MITRALVLASGLSVGALASQLPEFSQQYHQRLGGAVDALAEVAADFDASASAEGLSRTDALAQMRGTSFLDRRRTDMTRTFARYDKLQADLRVLQDAGPFLRSYYVLQSADRDVAAAALDTFQPAVPLTVPGGAFGGLGFFIGWLIAVMSLKLLAAPFARRRTARRA